MQYSKTPSTECFFNTFTRIHFDDLHDTGIYSWEYLYEVNK